MSQNDKLNRADFIDLLLNLIQTAEDAQKRWETNPDDVRRAMGYGYHDFRRAYFSDRDLHDANLEDIDFRDANVHHCNFSGANLRDACFKRAIAYDCDFTGANLRGADLEDGDFSAADFSNADLRDFRFYGANFAGAIGIKLLGPVGEYGRTIYAYTRNGEIRIQAGCFNGTPDELLAAIDNKYRSKNHGAERMDYRDAVKYLTRWGERELKRLRKLGILKADE